MLSERREGGQRAVRVRQALVRTGLQHHELQADRHPARVMFCSPSLPCAATTPSDRLPGVAPLRGSPHHNFPLRWAKGGSGLALVHGGRCGGAGARGGLWQARFHSGATLFCPGATLFCPLWWRWLWRCGIVTDRAGDDLDRQPPTAGLPAGRWPWLPVGVPPRGRLRCTCVFPGYSEGAVSGEGTASHNDINAVGCVAATGWRPTSRAGVATRFRTPRPASTTSSSRP